MGPWAGGSTGRTDDDREGQDAGPDRLWRVAIQEPGGRTIEVDSPSGWTLAEWQAYADRYHGPGCAVTPIAPLPKPSGTGQPR